MMKDKSIYIKNVYHMLSYAFTVLHQSNYADVEAEDFDNMQNLLAAILAKGIGQQLKQGLYREYTACTEELTVLRGKIDMPGTIRNRLMKKQAVTCEYDVLTENNLFNQILRSTVSLLLKQADVDDKYKSELKKEMLLFSGVEEIDLTQLHWNAVRFHRNNQTYRMLIGICQLIVQGMLMTTEQGDMRLASFIDEQRMCRLYERFILEFYRSEFPELSVSASQIPWALDDDAGMLLPVMQSDIMLRRGDRILIIDAKYYSHTLQKHFDAYTLHSGNLYQIFTYVKNESLSARAANATVSGMLLYARTDEEITPDNTYHMSGNEISVKTLDLNTDFPRIADQLKDIVRRYFD